MGMAIKRGLIILFGSLFQVLVSLAFYWFLISNVFVIHILYYAIGVIITLYLIRNSKSYSFTLPWIVLLLLFPLIGALLFIILGRNKHSSKTLRSIGRHEREIGKYLIQDENIKKEYENNGKIRHIVDFAGYPVSHNNTINYYPIGEEAYEAMLEELKNAKEFIFMEYFIIAKGKMWDSILEILKEKVANGVEVRVMYDDMGCLSTLPKDYPKELKKYNIKCVCFNRMSAFAGVIMNNRDHRKMLIIDGKVAFSGGINIADEYINEVHPYGHWKDNGIKIIGDAIWNYTVMFLTMWNSFREEDDDYTKYKYDFKDDTNRGLVVPYGETPLDNEAIGEDVYLNIINQANSYVYILTPYLLIDTDMINSLCLAAKRGVDVRIVIPGTCDSKFVHAVSKSYVEALIDGGVKVFEYTPGMVHAKVFVSDDSVATIGTLNLDYRSLYLHFECGCYMENVDIISDIKKDLVETINKSRKISKEEAQPSLLLGIWQSLLRLLAPLM